MNPMAEKLGDIAAEYIERYGFAIVPLKAKSKIPATSHGVNDWSDDADNVRKWLNDRPDYNLAIATGEASGNIIVIDIDKDDERGYDGYDALVDWEREHGELPETVSAITGRGGLHYYYRVNRPMKPSVNDDLHIDIRANGSYAMLPPSVHPNGRRVEWEHDPADYPIADADENVYAFLNAIRKREDAEHFELKPIIQIGSRNDTLYRLGCSLRAHNLDDTVIRAALVGANQTCVQPLDSDELEKITRSVLELPSGYSFQALVEGEVHIHNVDYFNPPPLKPALIEGVLRKGGVMMLGGASKAGKTFMLMQLAVAIASGTEWLGMQTMRGRVLYIDLEVDEAESDNRLISVIKHSGLDDEQLENAVAGIDVVNLRGIITGMEWLLRELPKMTYGRQYEVIILDPSYKVIDGDENLAKDVHAFTNNVDKLAKQMGASVIYCHHHSKGAKGDVRSIDRVSGSGVFARHADAVVDCIELEVSEDDREEYGFENNTCLRLEFVVRSFAQPEPIETVFDFPCHRRLMDGELSDAKPRTAQVNGGKKSGETRNAKKFECIEMVRGLATEWLSQNIPTRVADVAKIVGKSPRTVKGYVEDEIDDLRIVQREGVNFIEFL